MTESNKILTVSYGTFSCTLEGFDDPFGTMRGIAEYFRDLAAEDRYFGAEPPTPDVDMLQSIAQRNLQRRVEARIGDHGVSLQATDTVEDAELSEAKEAKGPRDRDDAPTASEEEAKETPPSLEDQSSEKVSETAPLAFEDEYLMADEPEDAFVVDFTQPPASESPPETIAEKLRRIRAVVSRNIEPEERTENVFEDDRAEEESAFSATPPKRERALSETIRSITEDIAEEDDAPAILADHEDERDSGDVEAQDSGDAIDASSAANDDNAFDVTDPEEPVAASGEAVSDEESALTADDDASGASDNDPRDSEDQSEAIIAGIMARGSADDQEGNTDESSAFNGHEPEDLSSEEPACDDDLADEDADTNVEDNRAPDEFAQEDAPVEAALEPLSEQNGDVGRLLKETDEKFADDDGIRRRRVISQMRAAVAATKAERAFTKMITPDERDEAEQSPYRSDLDKVITETIEANVESGSEEPEEAPVPEHAEPESERRATTPLVLVSSQRVDTTPEEPKQTRLLTDPVSGDSFADWAEKMGAEELPDLLEAAAAYSAFVEHQPHFSRPEIMKRVARIDPALSLSREAGLRSFGMLLRQGKIRKLQRGQFAISESTRFNPAQRIAGE